MRRKGGREESARACRILCVVCVPINTSFSTSELFLEAHNKKPRKPPIFFLSFFLSFFSFTPLSLSLLVHRL